MVGSREKPPRLVEHEHLQRARQRRIRDHRRRPVEQVKEQRLEDLGHAVEALEIDVLKRRQGHRVLDVIEEAGILPALHPALERAGQAPAGGWRAA